MPKNIDHRQMKDKIIKESFQVFKTDGYQALSMRKIATALGVSTGVLYHYFPDRDSLIKAILDNCLNDSILGVDKIEFFKPNAKLSLNDNLKNVFAKLDKDEPTALMTVLLLCDYYRSLSTRKSQKEHAKTAGKFLEAFRIALHLPESELPQAAMILTYVVGTLMVRMWTEEDESITEQSKLFLKMIENMK